ncbi:Predicted kinase [Actinoplanes regularis]|uniref:Predicted kinase n=1 Tax=Actinoplanes regularis TaxID=52697 RepID=A0A239I734_9ACTN|nr:hypothetical protein Are01nite_78160 [Actinoplanes regularis]SNS88883.1 Predicted kinase [Actinoplanes regularis]
MLAVVASQLILINGLPGSGKSTLAGPLASALRVPLIGKDLLKEAMAAAVPGIPSPALGIAASQAMWELAAAAPGGAVLESWWFKPRDLGFVKAGLDRCGSPTTVEIWCDVPAEFAIARYRGRRRAEIHEDQRRLTDSWPRWAAEAEPLRVGRTLMIDTSHPVDLGPLINQIRAEGAWPVAGHR